MLITEKKLRRIIKLIIKEQSQSSIDLAKSNMFDLLKKFNEKASNHYGILITIDERIEIENNRIRIAYKPVNNPIYRKFLSKSRSRINISDIVILIDLIFELQPKNAYLKCAGDLNNDIGFNISDVISLVAIILGD